MLFKKYRTFLSDNRSKSSRLYILDSTTISLFHEVLRTGGPTPASGRRKGGIKVQTMIRSDQDVPCMIRYGSGVSNDSRFLKEIYLPKGSIIVFDRGYHDFATFNRFTSEGVTWVTRRTKNFAMKMNDQIERSENDDCVISDTSVRIGHKDTKDKVNARLVQYLDPDTGELYEFVTNNLRMNAATIAGLYKKRWQIETLFKRLKQNYPLKYFLGDSENAIKIQIWCSLIADLLLKIIKKAVSVRWSFSNLAAMVRLHLMTYIDLFSFLKAPEKALLRLFYTPQKEDYNQLCLIT